ncbi:GNAT family N-acetyltransferase [Enterococcus sp. LJL90]
MYSVNYENQNCEIGISISNTVRGNRYGQEAMEILINFLFMYIPMNKIKLQVFSFNPNAI